METFLSLLVVAALAGFGVWAYRRMKDSGRSSSGPDRRTLDRSRRDSDEAAKAQARVVAADIARADSVIDGLARAVGNSDAVYNALAAISRAGGGAPGQDALRAAIGDPGVFDRPWWWLAAVADLAQRSGQDRVAAKVSSFTEMFVSQILPNLNIAGSMDAGLGTPPDAARARISEAALAATARLREDEIVISDRTGTVTVRAAETLAARALVALDAKRVPVDADALTRAATIVGGGGR